MPEALIEFAFKDAVKQLSKTNAIYSVDQPQKGIEMELRTFVKETLKDILGGIHDAQQEVEQGQIVPALNEVGWKGLEECSWDPVIFGSAGG